jgi:hypothetical protein
MESHRDFSSTSPKSKYVRIQDTEPSQIDPIPYYPNLHRQLHSFTASIILAYLEIHHPAPQDTPEAPVELDADAISRDIQIARRTLLVPLSMISVFWRSEEARARGARGNREFINLDHTRHGTTKPYSITGYKSLAPNTRWLLRRNYPFLRYLLQQADCHDAKLTLSVISVGGTPAQGVKSLGELIIAGSVLGKDGRSTKAERLLRKNSK